ncbi:MAG: 50S ribosomal protein L25 [Planctomycetaceae bacterium]|jgi:large subunit ribosomal protein L25|nr:50S ribosomal protein L25 [Planctomycetaceae bacterium]MDP7274188.1 50S ribosomal protein L25 [Planctomycetaceae bacterium]
MATDLLIELNNRTETEVGTVACQRLREKGQTPGVIYGNQIETELISTATDSLKPLIDRGIRVLDVTLNGETQKAMFREVQWDTFGIYVNHFDLLRINPDQRIEIEVQIELRGTAPGTSSGGQLEQPLHGVMIDCLAVEVPERLTIRINHLEIDDAVTAGELELAGNARLLTDPDAVIARVVEVREEEDEVAEDGLEMEAAEPEVIGRASDDEDEENDDDE